MNRHNILVLTDNLFLYKEFKQIVSELNLSNTRFVYRHSPTNEVFLSSHDFFPINVKLEWKRIISQFDLVLSLHCKQMFPKELIEKVRCINIHPGYNPYNRGWFPQVFSIINKKPLGVTIHEIDGKLDHGPIIVQEEVSVYSWDTSLEAYNRVISKELELIRKNLPRIITGDYEAKLMQEEGNTNFKKDFDSLCEINLKENTTVGELIDKLRALTHGEYRNCFFVDEDGIKVFVTIALTPDDQ